MFSSYQLSVGESRAYACMSAFETVLAVGIRAIPSSREIPDMRGKFGAAQVVAGIGLVTFAIITALQGRASNSKLAERCFVHGCQLTRHGVLNLARAFIEAGTADLINDGHSFLPVVSHIGLAAWDLSALEAGARYFPYP